MTLKKTCPCCKLALTTKNTKRIGRDFMGETEFLYLNCRKCNSTIVIGQRPERKSA